MSRYTYANPVRPSSSVSDDEFSLEYVEDWERYIKQGGKDLRDIKVSLLRLKDVDLRGADLTGSDFTNSKFEHVDLRDAQLERTIFDHSSITWTDFRGSNLSHASFESCFFGNNDLRHTNLIGVSIPEHDIEEYREFGFTEPARLPAYFKLLRQAGMKDLREIKGDFFDLRRYFRNRGLDSLGELIELEMRSDMDQGTVLP
jgi:hypothetical protein